MTTTRYTYTANLHPQDAQENFRQRLRLTRAILMPSALRANPYFMDFIKSIDDMLDGPVEEATEALFNIRNPWLLDANAAIEAGEILDRDHWSMLNVVDRQLAFLGFTEVHGLTDIQKTTLLRFLGRFWLQKGRSDAGVDFLNYCLGLDLRLLILWTRDYVTFVPETMVNGPTVYEDYNGGWYPTTHVELSAGPLSSGLSDTNLTELFYAVAPVTAILHKITRRITNG